jgi:hypothetical protein
MGVLRQKVVSNFFEEEDSRRCNITNAGILRKNMFPAPLPPFGMHQIKLKIVVSWEIRTT